MDNGIKRYKRKTRLDKLNPDKTRKEDRVQMTDTEIIKSWIDAGQSVLLRGPSGIGKTDRIRTLYPDLIYLKLTNNMFPEKVVGAMNLQTGQAIPPDFAKTAIMNCATESERKLVEENVQNLYKLADYIYERSKDSKKKTVILLDELLNVKPPVQGLVYTLVLNKFIESGNGLKLPANTVVVATGNQKRYSILAEDLAEPLEKRFDHIFDMEARVGSWLSEYAIPNKLHPMVVGYIVGKYISNGCKEGERNIDYFYEEPEIANSVIDISGNRYRTNDPRGWTAISNILYAFEKDVKGGKFVGKDIEDLFKTTIHSKLENKWADEFIAFYNLPTMSYRALHSHGYKFGDSELPENFESSIMQQTALAFGLVDTDIESYRDCHAFMASYCQSQVLAYFAKYWAGTDTRRIEEVKRCFSEFSNLMQVTKQSEVAKSTYEKSM